MTKAEKLAEKIAKAARFNETGYPLTVKAQVEIFDLLDAEGAKGGIDFSSWGTKKAWVYVGGEYAEHIF